MMQISRRFALQWIGMLLLAVGSLTPPPPAMAAEPASPVRIGVIGSGRIGSTLGAAWIKAGHEVMFSSLNLEQDKALAASLGPKAHAGTTREAAEFGSVLLVSVPYSAMPAVGKDLGERLKGKIVIDTSNPVPGRDGDVGVKSLEKGAGLASAEFLPGARIVRGFNAIGFNRLRELTQAQTHKVGMPIAGDDKEALATASTLVKEAGLTPVVVGSLVVGRHLRPGTPLAGELTPEQIQERMKELR